jgi:hypothetical protein
MFMSLVYFILKMYLNITINQYHSLEAGGKHGCCNSVKSCSSCGVRHFPKSSIFLDITPCNPLKMNPLSGGTCRLHLQGRRISKQETSVKQVAGLHGVISQKIELFITTAVRTSNSTRHFLFLVEFLSVSCQQSRKSSVSAGNRTLTTHT